MKLRSGGVHGTISTQIAIDYALRMGSFGHRVLSPLLPVQETAVMFCLLALRFPEQVSTTAVLQVHRPCASVPIVLYCRPGSYTASHKLAVLALRRVPYFDVRRRRGVSSAGSSLETRYANAVHHERALTCENMCFTFTRFPWPPALSTCRPVSLGPCQ